MITYSASRGGGQRFAQQRAARQVKDHYFLADLLGFSSIVSNLSGPALDKRIGDWVNLVQRIRPAAPGVEVQLISDTIFVREEGSEEGLKRLLSFCRTLLEEGIAHALPVRGAVTFGPLEWGTLTYGKVVVEAHRLETDQDWIGVACVPKLPHFKGLWDWGRVVVYPVPMKSGTIRLHPAVAWTVPATDELCRQTLGEGLFAAGDLIPWEWQRKISHTAAFGRYLRHAESGGANPKSFGRGSPATESIDPYWR